MRAAPVPAPWTPSPAALTVLEALEWRIADHVPDRPACTERDATLLGTYLQRYVLDASGASPGADGVATRRVDSPTLGQTRHQARGEPSRLRVSRGSLIEPVVRRRTGTSVNSDILPLPLSRSRSIASAHGSCRSARLPGLGGAGQLGRVGNLLARAGRGPEDHVSARVVAVAIAAGGASDRLGRP